MKLATNRGWIELPSLHPDLHLESFAVRTAFSWGHCHSLAAAIHQITGWPTVGLYSVYDADNSPAHVAVRVPDGRLLDIDGFSINVQTWYTAHDVDVEQLVHYRKPHITAAIPFAIALLEKHGFLPKQLTLSFAA